MGCGVCGQPEFEMLDFPDSIRILLDTMPIAAESAVRARDDCDEELPPDLFPKRSSRRWAVAILAVARLPD
jgi:hypothetical protein